MSWNPNDWNPVTLKTLTGCLMAVGLGATVCIAMLEQIPLSEAILLEFSTFVAAWGGISYAAYSKERDSDYGALDRQAAIERAKAATPAPVTVQAPATVTVTPSTPVEVSHDPG